MASSETDQQLEWVTVNTTLPVFPYPAATERLDITTERLLLRPLREADVDALHELRSQPEVMKWTTRGTTDADLGETKEHLQTMLPPNDGKMLQFAICLAETGEFIGIGGSHKRDGELGWPVMGYMFRKEAWGKGYGTEFVRALLDEWWALPRENVQIKVERSTVDGDEGEVKDEVFIAVTERDNKASQNVLGKCGLFLAKTWTEADTQVGKEDEMVTLLGFAAKRPAREPHARD